uniref:Solute carrier family 22 member 9 n=1 Tax=Jaculus jaculus TaxID=51337 RepID=A0A8C5K9A3_JACJA
VAFQDLLNQVSSLGRFQILQIAFLFMCNIMAVPHVLLENSILAISSHHCWIHLIDNDPTSDNDTGMFSQEALLRISILLDSGQRPEKCRHFTQPQKMLLYTNVTFSNMSEPGCVDGWGHEQSSFLSTTVTETVRSTVKEELEAAQSQPSLCDLFRSSNLCKWICHLSFVKFALWISDLGMFTHLQYLGSKVFLLQCLLDAVNIPVNYVVNFALNYIGRRKCQPLLMSLEGILTLALLFAPQEKHTKCMVLAALGGGFCYASGSSSLVHENELFPTII